MDSPEKGEFVHSGMLWRLDSHEDNIPESGKNSLVSLSQEGVLSYSIEDGAHNRVLIRGISFENDHLVFATCDKPVIFKTETTEEHTVWMKHLAEFKRMLHHPGPERIRSASRQSRARSRSASKSDASRSRRGSHNLAMLSAEIADGSRSRRGSHNLAMLSADCPESGIGPIRFKSRSTSRTNTTRKTEPQEPVIRDRTSTALIVDWDDTLFPTTWLLEDAGMVCHKPLTDQLSPGARCDCITSLMNQHAHQVEQFLKEAANSAVVFIVTLARLDWVERSIRYFMPSLNGLLDEKQIQVVYASNFLEENLKTQMNKNGKPVASATAAEDTMELFIEAKADAIMSALTRVDKEAGRGQLGHLVSIGDSDIERHGTADASQRYSESLKSGENPNSGDELNCKGKTLVTKTLKLLEEPTIEELKAQLIMIRRWLPFLVAEKEELDLEIESTEEDSALMELHKMITGQDESLSWSNLAGMSTHPIKAAGQPCDPALGADPIQAC